MGARYRPSIVGCLFKRELAQVRWADPVLVMEDAQRRDLARLIPESVGKTYLLGHWNRSEVPDPYMQDIAQFEYSRELIEGAVSAWLNRL
ncbi:MAG: hypothetical protein H6926_09335 [Chromatiales bacterium]|nr:hypothetical protein [Chromatiales bacterium]